MRNVRVSRETAASSGPQLDVPSLDKPLDVCYWSAQPEPSKRRDAPPVLLITQPAPAPVIALTLLWGRERAEVGR